MRIREAVLLLVRRSSTADPDETTTGRVQHENVLRQNNELLDFITVPYHCRRHNVVITSISDSQPSRDNRHRAYYQDKRHTYTLEQTADSVYTLAYVVSMLKVVAMVAVFGVQYDDDSI